MARIYTRTGDGGQTSLGDGTRTTKSAARIDLYGEIDELNSFLGCCLALLDGDEDPAIGALSAGLQDVQSQLLTIGAVLADPRRCRDLAARPIADQPFPVKRLETLIDALDRGLTPLTAFILPGGTPAAGWLHVARTVCRRVERKAVALAAQEPVPAGVIVCLNRLSDFLFTAARAINARAGVPDVLWRPEKEV